MTQSTADMFTIRKPLAEICRTPERIISVYSLEKYVWDGSEPQQARRERRAELRTVEEFQINPVRHFLNDVLRRMATPYRKEQRDNPIGQGYWLQAEFGSGKSHLLCFLSALALGDARAWEIVRQREQAEGKGRRESLYNFWENGLKEKSETERGIFVVGKTLVGAGSGAVGIADGARPLSEYILNAVRDQFFAETGKNLSLYPAEMLADRFLQTDLERYQNDLKRFLQDPNFFSDEEMQSSQEFLQSMQDTRFPQKKLDCGRTLWRFYTEYLKVQPSIDADQEVVLKHMVESLLAEGYQGVLLVLDEISLFAEGRTIDQKSEDEQTLVLLANRLAKIHNLPLWTICAAQQKIVTRMGVGNIIADDRLKLIELLKGANDYYDIVLSRVREITEPDAMHNYYEFYRHGFTWPVTIGEPEFKRFFPFHRPALEVLRAVTFGLTTCRSAIHIMHQTLNLQIQRGKDPNAPGAGTELIRLWELFDEAVRYEEDAGSTHLLADIKTKWSDAARAFETCEAQINSVSRGTLKTHRSKAIQVLQTLFLYHIAQTRQQGLTPEEIANSVLVPIRDDSSPAENIGDYETLVDALKRELPQIQSMVDEDKQVRYRFTPEMVATRPTDEFNKARAEVAASDSQQKKAWERLLALRRWEVRARQVTHDMSHGKTSLFSDIAPFYSGGDDARNARPGEQDKSFLWHGRQIAGLVGMYDLQRIATEGAALPRLETRDGDLDFAVLVSTQPLSEETRKQLLNRANDPRILFWSPDELTSEEKNRLLDFGAFFKMILDHTKEAASQTQEDVDLLNWVASALQTELGRTIGIVRSSYARGVISARDFSKLEFASAGELSAILEPVVGRVLDAVYVSKDIHFENLAAFRKEEAVKVINGLVRTGAIPPNTLANQDISAAQNYGPGLKIIKRVPERVGESLRDAWKLDTTGNPYVEALWKFLDDKLGEDGGGMPINTLYMNFMGLGGPGGVNYGLSRRLIQIYLLCLVQQGKARVTVNSRSGLPTDIIDYGNIGTIAFNAKALEALDQVQKVARPQNWEVLRPYAEKLLEKPIALALDDAAISELRRELQQRFVEEKRASKELQTELDGLFVAIQSENPLAQSLQQIVALFATDLSLGSDIDLLLEALESRFEYRAYREGEARQSELDDLANRMKDYRNLQSFARDAAQIRTAYAYVHHHLPELPALQASREHQAILARHLQDLRPYIDSEVERTTMLIGANPPLPQDRGTLNALLEEYRGQYIHLHNVCTGEMDGRRNQVKALLTSDTMRAFRTLEGITALQPRITPELTQQIEALAAEIFQCTQNTYASLEGQLRSEPFHNCSLQFDNNEAHRLKAEQNAAQAVALFSEALNRKISVFLNATVRERLQQGAQEPVIAGLLACTDLDSTRSYLIREALENENMVATINRYLKQVMVRRVRLADFKPSVNTLEAGGVPDLTEEFRRFLQAELSAIDGEDIIPVLQLE